MKVGEIYDLGESYLSNYNKFQQKVKDGETINPEGERRYAAEGSAELLVGSNYAILSANKDAAVALGENTVAIKGRTHLASTPSDIRINGFWVLNEELLTTIPSTLFNPVQTLLYKAPPFVEKARRFVKLMQDFGI